MSKTKLTIVIPTELHRLMKVECAQQKMTLQEFAIAAFEQQLNNQPELVQSSAA